MKAKPALPERVRSMEYEGTSHLPANGVEAPRLMVFEVINLQPM
ncbi:hypothetical protein [Roseateles sp.]